VREGKNRVVISGGYMRGPDAGNRTTTGTLVSSSLSARGAEMIQPPFYDSSSSTSTSSSLGKLLMTTLQCNVPSPNSEAAAACQFDYYYYYFMMMLSLASVCLGAHTAAARPQVENSRLGHLKMKRRIYDLSLKSRPSKDIIIYG